MDADTLARLDRIERRIEAVVAFCDGVLTLAMPALPKLVRPMVKSLADKLHRD